VRGLGVRALKGTFVFHSRVVERRDAEIVERDGSLGAVGRAGAASLSRAVRSRVFCFMASGTRWSRRGLVQVRCWQGRCWPRRAKPLRCWQRRFLAGRLRCFLSVWLAGGERSVGTKRRDCAWRPSTVGFTKDARCTREVAKFNAHVRDDPFVVVVSQSYRPKWHRLRIAPARVLTAEGLLLGIAGGAEQTPRREVIAVDLVIRSARGLAEPVQHSYCRDRPLIIV